VTLATLDRQAPPTLRAAVEAVERVGGRVEVRGGRLVVSLPPGEVGPAPWFGGEQAGGRAAGRREFATSPRRHSWRHAAATAGSMRQRSRPSRFSLRGDWPRRQHFPRRVGSAAGGRSEARRAARPAGLQAAARLSVVGLRGRVCPPGPLYLPRGHRGSRGSPPPAPRRPAHPLERPQRLDGPGGELRWRWHGPLLAR